MAEDVFETITTAELLEMFEIERPNNEHREKGYALVNVLKPKAFDQERIPGFINIPMGSDGEFEQRFAKDKEIIVYDDFLECGAATQAARELVQRGFHRV
jgi:rhodanese-related sulfurtransferase